MVFELVPTVRGKVPAKTDTDPGVTVKVTFTVPRFRLTVVGEYVAPDGKPETVRLTLVLPLPFVVIVSGNVTRVVAPYTVDPDCVPTVIALTDLAA